MDKEQQAKLLSEIMKADERDGLYDSDISKMETTQTALEWLIEQCPRIETIVAYNILEQAKAMEEEQIEKNYYDGVNDGRNNTIKYKYFNYNVDITKRNKI